MTSNIRLALSTLLSLISGIGLLIYMDEGTLFLSALLLSVLAIKNINSKVDSDSNFDTHNLFISSFIGLWFALSIAPAFSIKLEEITILTNGFLIQALLSFVFFIIFYVTKISIIGRIESGVKGGVGIVVSSLISGAAAGISSASLWQFYLYLK